MSDLRFRRMRLARWADEATLDRLEGEYDELSAEDKAERNAFIDSASDADIRAMFGEETEDDVAAKAKPKGRRSHRGAAPAEAPAASEGDADESDAGGGSEE